MSLGRRLLNVAKAEITDAARRLKTSAEHILDGDFGHTRHGDPDLDAIRAEVEAEEAARAAGRAPPARSVSPEVQTWYANLELPLGASAAEVKAAYRRLMRRYHPDKHALDPDQAKVATEISQKLRTAYEGLLAHLGEG